MVHVRSQWPVGEKRFSILVCCGPVVVEVTTGNPDWICSVIWLVLNQACLAYLHSWKWMFYARITNDLVSDMFLWKDQDHHRGDSCVVKSSSELDPVLATFAVFQRRAGCTGDCHSYPMSNNGRQEDAEEIGPGRMVWGIHTGFALKWIVALSASKQLWPSLSWGGEWGFELDCP